MRSRFLVGASAWLLGVLTATGGSMFAVSQLAHGLLGPDTQQLSPAAVQDALAAYRHPGAALAGTASARLSRPRASAAATPSLTASPTPAGTLLVSQAGTATATCQSGLAYLLYWSPYPGYQANDVVRGPAQQAILDFEGGAVGVRMRVSCSGSVPAAQLSDLPSAGFPPRHDE